MKIGRFSCLVHKRCASSVLVQAARPVYLLRRVFHQQASMTHALVLTSMSTNTIPRRSARLSVVAVAMLISLSSTASMASRCGIQHGEGLGTTLRQIIELNLEGGRRKERRLLQRWFQGA